MPDLRLYHLISRCVRRAFICSDAAEHRRGWLEQGIKAQAQAVAINVLTVVVISNHLHIVVKTDSQGTQGWCRAKRKKGGAKGTHHLNKLIRESEASQNTHFVPQAWQHA